MQYSEDIEYSEDFSDNSDPKAALNDIEYSEDFSDNGNPTAPLNDGGWKKEELLEGDWNTNIDISSVHDVPTFTGDNEEKYIDQKEYIISVLPDSKAATLNLKNIEVTSSNHYAPDLNDDKVNGNDDKIDSSILIPEEVSDPNTVPTYSGNIEYPEDFDDEQMTLLNKVADVVPDPDTVPTYSGNIEYPEDFDDEQMTLLNEVADVVPIIKAVSEDSLEDLLENDWDNYLVDKTLSSNNVTNYDEDNFDTEKKIDDIYCAEVDDFKQLNDRADDCGHSDTLPIDTKESQLVANLIVCGDIEYPEDFNNDDAFEQGDDALLGTKPNDVVFVSEVARADSKDFLSKVLDGNLDNLPAAVSPYTYDEENECKLIDEVESGKSIVLYVVKDDKAKELNDSLLNNGVGHAVPYSSFVHAIVPSIDNDSKVDYLKQIIDIAPRIESVERVSFTETEESNFTSNKSFLTEDWERYLNLTSDNGVDEYQLNEEDDFIDDDGNENNDGGDDKYTSKEDPDQVDKPIIADDINDVVPYVEVWRKDSFGPEVLALDDLKNDQIVLTSEKNVAIDNDEEDKYYVVDDNDKSRITNRNFKKKNSSDVSEKIIEEIRSFSGVMENVESNHVDGIQNAKTKTIPISPLPSDSNQAHDIFDHIRTNTDTEKLVKVSTSPTVTRLFTLLDMLRNKSEEIKMLVNETDLYWRRQIEIKQQKIAIELQFMKSLHSSHKIKCLKEINEENRIKLSKRCDSQQQLQRSNISRNCHYSALTDLSKGRIRTTSIDYLKPKQLQQYVNVSSSNSQSNYRHAMELSDLSLR
jgi:hypothetical protein